MSQLSWIEKHKNLILVGVIVGVIVGIILAIINGVGPQIFPIGHIFDSPTFSLSIEPNRGEVTQGNVINTTIILGNLGVTKYKGKISLIANLLNMSDAMERSINFTFDPKIVNIETEDKFNSTLSIKTGLDLIPGTYEIIIKAKGQDVERTNKYILDVMENYPPNVSRLVPDKPSPQYPGTDITWTAVANDTEDNILYKFWLKGFGTSNRWEIKQDWSYNNTWVWNTKWNSQDEGNPYNIKVSVRDGKHSNKEGDDARLESPDYYLKFPELEAKIQNPHKDEEVQRRIEVSGTISRPLEKGRHMWILVMPIDVSDQWYPQGGGETTVMDGKWRGPAWIGNPEDSGREFYIIIISVNDEDNVYLRTGPTNIALPDSAEQLDIITVKRI